MCGEVARMLNPQQMKFVVEYLKTNVGKSSAIAAGYAAGSASSKASQLLRNKLVIEEIKKTQTLIQNEGIYNLKKAMEDADRAYEIARANCNAAAMTSAATLKAKLAGLMVERSEVKQIGFQIVIKGYDE